MGLLLYRAGLLLYRIILKLASLFNPKAKKLIQGKQNWIHEIEGLPDKPPGKRTWFHCASLGEFEQGRPLMEGLKKEFPDLQILLTFFSPSGYEVRKNYALADHVLYLPWDTPGNARKFFNLLKPDLVVFVKYEFWYFMLKEASSRQIPCVLVSGIFRPSQLFFKNYGRSYRRIFDFFEHLFVQNQQSYQLLLSVGVTHTTISGDTRFDRVTTISQQAEDIAPIDIFKETGKILVAGSVWPDDMERILPVINKNETGLKFIIAPHEINKAQIQGWRNQIKLPCLLFSELQHSEKNKIASATVLMIDNVGMLSSLYKYGEFAFVGGAYGPGLHNILEAIAYGMPVFFGNRNYTKFQEARDTIGLGVGTAIGTSDELNTKLKDLLDDDDLFHGVCKKAREYVSSKAGATKIVLDYLGPKIGGL